MSIKRAFVWFWTRLTITYHLGWLLSSLVADKRHGWSDRCPISWLPSKSVSSPGPPCTMGKIICELLVVTSMQYQVIVCSLYLNKQKGLPVEEPGAVRWVIIEALFVPCTNLPSSRVQQMTTVITLNWIGDACENFQHFSQLYIYVKVEMRFAVAPGWDRGGGWN